MEKLFKGWIDRTPAGSPRVRSRDELTGKIIPHITIPKDFRVQTPDGTWHDAEWAAKMHLRKLESDHFLGRHGYATKTSESLPELIEKYFERKRHLAWKTLDHYETSMNHFQKEFTWENFTSDGFWAWKKKLEQQGLKNNTINNIIGDVIMFCNWLVEEKKIEKSPVPTKDYRPGMTQPIARFWTLEEFLKLDQVLEGLNHDARVACRLAHDCGLRKVEIVGDGNERLAGVLWGDVYTTPDGRMDLVIRAEVTKGRKNVRRVRLSPSVVSLLGSRKIGPLVPLPWTKLNFLFAKARKLAGLGDLMPPRTFHGLRHSHGTDYVQSGGSLKALQQSLGHKTSKPTEIYSQLQPSYVAGVEEMVAEKRAQQEALINRGEQAWSKKVKIVELSGAVMHQDAPDDNEETLCKIDKNKISDGK